MQGDNSTTTLTCPSFTASPDAIRQNCTFIASLCSSLLSATGAVVAKQWLVNYAGQDAEGSLETQCLRRGEKFIAAREWALQAVVEFLPSLLLISLLLFFAALADYLWMISKPVAVVVTSFTFAGILFYVVSVFLAAIYSSCPYNTSVSTRTRMLATVLSKTAQLTSAGIRRAIVKQTREWKSGESALLDNWRRKWSESTATTWHHLLQWMVRVRATASRSLNALLIWASRGSEGETLEEERPDREHDAVTYQHPSVRKQVQYARAVVRMLPLIAEDDDFRAVAENILTLTHYEAVREIATDGFFPALIAQVRKCRIARALLLEDSKDVTHETALLVTYARAVAHVFAAGPMELSDTIWEVLQDIWLWELPPDTPDTDALVAGMLAVCLRCKWNHTSHDAWSLRLINRVVENLNVIHEATVLSLVTLWTISGLSVTVDQALERYILVLPTNPGFLGLTSLGLQQDVEHFDRDQRIQPDALREIWLARTGFVFM